ncbi:hypothetical protein K8S17_04115 [bacterium]|nr:hypothetical protein [bacterium]
MHAQSANSRRTSYTPTMSGSSERAEFCFIDAVAETAAGVLKPFTWSAVFGRTESAWLDAKDNG